MGSSQNVPLDAAELLTALARHGVDCVLIGGVAMQVHGHVRTTQDVDVVAAWTCIDLTDPRQLLEGGNFLMHTRFGELDVFAADQTPGAPPYPQLRARAVAVEIRGARLLIAHPEDLIRMKGAAARFGDRPEAKRRQDLDDIAVLERLRALE